MAKRKAASKSTLATLRRRYKRKLPDLRADFAERAAETATRAQSEYELMIRQFRREVAELKKQGLISSKVDARRAKPTAALSREVNRFYDVLVGRRKAKTVSKAQARSLKEQGFTVRGNKVVLSDRYEVRDNRVYETAPKVPGGTVSSEPVTNITLTGNWEDKIRAFMRGMDTDEYIGIDLGPNFSKLFNKRQVKKFIEYVTKYKERERWPFFYVTLIKIPEDEADDYELERMHHRIRIHRTQTARQKARKAAQRKVRQEKDRARKQRERERIARTIAK